MQKYNFRSDPRISPWQRELLREFCSSLEEDIAKLANGLGLKIFKEELLPYERGYLKKDPAYGSASGWVIKINENDRPKTQNFTIAHELGHFMLHGRHLATLDEYDGRVKRNTADCLDPFSYLEDRDQLMEAEANKFAAALLMPPNLFRPAFSRLNGDISALSNLFFVSESAVNARIRELRL